MTEKASQEAIDWLDENAVDGGFLFTYNAAGLEYVYVAGGAVVGGATVRYSPIAHSIFDAGGAPPMWKAGGSPTSGQWSSDSNLSDEQLQDFLDAYGFKPVEAKSDVEEDYVDAEPLPSLDYIHVDAIRDSLLTGGGLTSLQLACVVETFLAFEALRRARL